MRHRQGTEPSESPPYCVPCRYRHRYAGTSSRAVLLVRIRRHSGGAAASCQRGNQRDPVLGRHLEPPNTAALPPAAARSPPSVLALLAAGGPTQHECFATELRAPSIVSIVPLRPGGHR